MAAEETARQIADIAGAERLDQAEQHAANHCPRQIADAAQHRRSKGFEAEHETHLVMGNFVIGTDHDASDRAERIVISQDDDGYQRGVATGSGSALARFRQKREGVDEYVEGEAERIEHDARNEKTEFFMRARVKSGQDEVRGQYISYDARNEQYVVTSGPDGTRARPGSNERVRAVIQPKNKKEDAPATPPKGKPGSTSAAPRPAAPVPALKSAQDIANPREETPK